MFAEAHVACVFESFPGRCDLVGLFEEPIDILSQLRSLVKSRFQEIRMPQRPTMLLGQVRDVMWLKDNTYSIKQAYVCLPNRSVCQATTRNGHR